ncbi:MAG: YbaB/EbfC family nucleoid-associated protein [Chthoniobacteraceae bacterium]
MNIQKMMKQAQKMQEQLARAQEDLAAKTVEASAAGGKVTVVATCAGDIVSIKIAKEVVDPEDVEFLEEMVLTGVKAAIAKGREESQQEMGKLTGGMGLPPGLL